MNEYVLKYVMMPNQTAEWDALPSETEHNFSEADNDKAVKYAREYLDELKKLYPEFDCFPYALTKIENIDITLLHEERILQNEKA